MAAAGVHSRQLSHLQEDKEQHSLSLDCLILKVVPASDPDEGPHLWKRSPIESVEQDDEDALCLGKEEQVCGIIDRFQTDCDVMKIDVQCAVQGGVVLECIHLDLESDREEMMFWVMFNTAFIRSNILMLNRDDIDILWNGKECFSKDSRPEVSKQS
ncbi:hypothetical protein SELMODRAFT_423187 [Selaginella moellendorffii]|uniref:C2 tensin-type domain-containing protein n=1 Tax=Selaginella moellendorffii TaxID=88036 RepID=D8SKV2_SELML|nr:hypothetical protein SELMODRAFT_423187 [Selaginella moellendorffii]